MRAPYEKSHSLPDLKGLTLCLILDSYEKISHLFNAQLFLDFADIPSRLPHPSPSESAAL